MHLFWSSLNLSTVSLITRFGGFAPGRAHHAVSVHRQHHVHQGEPAGEPTLPRTPLLCHAAGHALRPHPVGGRRHAALRPLQTLAAEGGRAAITEGEGSATCVEMDGHTHTYRYIYSHSGSE